MAVVTKDLLSPADLFMTSTPLRDRSAHDVAPSGEAQRIRRPSTPRASSVNRLLGVQSFGQPVVYSDFTLSASSSSRVTDCSRSKRGADSCITRSAGF